MQVRTSHGDFLRFVANLPNRPDELHLPASQSFYAHHPSGDYYYQQIETDHYTVFKSLYRPSATVSLHVQADKPWLGFRLVLKNHIRHFMGGAREVYLMQGQFNFAYQPRINNLLLLEKGQEYLVFDMAVSPDFLQSLQLPAPLDELLHSMQQGQPYLLLPRFAWGDAAVFDALDDFERCPLADPAAGKLLKRIINAALYVEPGPVLSPEKVEGIFRARDMIKSNLHGHLTLQQLSKAAAMNEFTFKQTFRQVFKTTPYQYLKHLRLRTAKLLLKTTHQTLQRIAQQAGYQHDTALIAAFRKAYHQSPAQWRSQHSGCMTE